jgi:hypothetical protein
MGCGSPSPGHTRRCVHLQSCGHGAGVQGQVVGGCETHLKPLVCSAMSFRDAIEAWRGGVGETQAITGLGEVRAWRNSGIKSGGTDVHRWVSGVTDDVVVPIVRNPGHSPLAGHRRPWRANPHLVMRYGGHLLTGPAPAAETASRPLPMTIMAATSELCAPAGHTLSAGLRPRRRLRPRAPRARCWAGTAGL